MMPAPPAPPEEDFFDASFMAELEELAATPSPQAGPQHVPSTLPEKLSAFLAPPPDLPQEGPLTEEGFAGLPTSRLAERTNTLIELCRQGGKSGAVQAVENFVVFFQALVPTLSQEGSRQIKRLFFRLVPTLIHIAYNDFSASDEGRAEGLAALRNLETILIEISSVRLAPTESELVFRSIDQMASLIGVGEYAMADQIISSHLLSIIARNKLTRALYRIMEVEVSIQKYLNEKLGYRTPQFRIPEDIAVLSEYGPLQIFLEEAPDGARRRFLQVHLPEIPIVRDVVLHLVSEDAQQGEDLRLDGLGTVELTVPDGAYRLGLVYQPKD